jgi:hypothetical protein
LGFLNLGYNIKPVLIFIVQFKHVLFVLLEPTKFSS